MVDKNKSKQNNKKTQQNMPFSYDQTKEKKLVPTPLYLIYLYSDGILAMELPIEKKSPVRHNDV